MDSGKEKNDSVESKEREEDPGGGGEGGAEPGGTQQEKPPDEVAAANPDESQRSLSEVSQMFVIEITTLLSSRFLEL